MSGAAALWSPIHVGTLRLEHRLIMAAMGSGFAAAEGRATDRLVRYLARRAEGGIALVTTEATAVDASGAPFPVALRADDDGLLEGLGRVAEAVHAHGVPISMQLYHAGRQMSRRISGRQPVAPSALPCPMVREMPRALEGEEIPALVERFAEAAARAREAGFDAIELHGSHGYLIHQFLTPLANQRTDQWGGDLAGRARFALAVVRRIRERLGPGFPLLYKLSAEDRLPGGLTLDDTLVFGRWLEEAGVDALIVSAGTYASFQWIVQPLGWPQACLRGQAARFSETLRIPVAAVGRINDPAVAEEVVERGEAQLVAMGRALLADPDLPRKARAGRRGDLLRCITCNECLARLMKAEPIRCAINPEMGREAEFPPPPAARRRRIVVVGGGPAGMQAALVARRRGHEVTLLEAAEALGGRLSLADRPAFKREVGELAPHWARRLAEAGVAVRLGTRATPEEIGRLAADVVVVAAGARVTLPALPGMDAPHVTSVEQCLAGDGRGAGPAVVLGGGRAACEAAGYLREGGWEVTLLAPGRDVARDVEPQTRRGLTGELHRLGVRIVTEARAEAIEAGGVRYTDAAGQPAAAPAALVVVEGTLSPDDALQRRLEAEGLTVFAAGDSAAPGDLAAAVHGATDLALGL